MGASPSADSIKDEGLYAAAAHGDAVLVEQYLADAANPNHRDKEDGNATPLIAAAQDGAADIITLLLRAPACDVQIQDTWGLTACHYAARFGHEDCLRLLIEAQADLTIRASDGFSAAHVAAERGHADCLAILCEHGANINARTKEGATVSMLAADEACRDVLERNQMNNESGNHASHQAVGPEREPLIGTV